MSENKIGIIRKIDHLGRIVIPVEMRKRLSILDSTPLSLIIKDDNIIISKISNNCIICGKEIEERSYVTNSFIDNICIDCMHQIVRYFKG